MRGVGMELVTKKKLHIVSGRANLPLAEEIASCLEVPLGEANTTDFANGEIHCRFGESVRGMDVFIIQSHGGSGDMSINDTLMEHVQMVDAARRASAKRITAVMPFYGYGRQDRKAIVHKRRVKGAKNQVEAKEVVGNVEGRTCVLIDDMIDTGGTLVAAAEQLVEQGASSVVAAATHGVLSGPAIDRLKNSGISKVVVTNTLPLPPEKQIDKIEVVSVARVIADAIDAVFEDTSVSEIFDGANLS
jgi:phosphoribosylpyrophosphate synthetase